MARFAFDEVTEVETQKISTFIGPAEKIARENQRCDITFRMAILLSSTTVVVASAIASANIDGKTTQTLIIVVAICGGTLTLLSGFAFNQFDFRRRQTIWAAKAAALRAPQDGLIPNPDKDASIRRLTEVKSWDDNNPPSQLTSPQPATQTTATQTIVNPEEGLSP